MKILATSGGFLPTDYGAFQWQRGPLIEHAIELAGNPDRARFCYLGTAAGDSLNGTAGFYRAFAGSDVRASTSSCSRSRTSRTSGRTSWRRT